MLRFLLVLLLTPIVAAQADVPVHDYRVVETLAHRPNAFTQGLLVHDGVLYEGTGRYGRSTIARLSLEDGSVLDSRSLNARYFGEGIAVAGGRLYQLTWRENTVFVRDPRTLEVETTHYFPGEGWGLTWNGEHLILSDGSATLQFIEPASFTVTRRVRVRSDGEPVDQLNELEYIDGEVWANVWQSDRIVRIDPDTGEVGSAVDLSGLRARTRARGSGAVLNGIAWDPDNERLLVTGKLWADIFEIELVAPSPDEGS